jgi:hypothetical protein
VIEDAKNGEPGSEHVRLVEEHAEVTVRVQV